MKSLVIIILLPAVVNSSLIQVPKQASAIAGNTVYTLFTDQRTWKEARAICRNIGGYLMDISTQTKLQTYADIKDIFGSSALDDPWIGLYWSSPTDRHFDGPGCPPPTVELSSTFHWRGNDDYNYKSSEPCYREHDGFEDRVCDERNTFICETHTESGCLFEKTQVARFKISTPGAVPSLEDCVNTCRTTAGCFLTGAVDDVCAMLLTQDATNTTLAIKTCSYETEQNDNSFDDIPSDDSDPTECVALQVTPSSNTFGCLTTTVTSTETINVTVTETYNFTDYVTIDQTVTDYISVTEIVPTTVITTEQLIITTVQGIAPTPSAVTVTVMASPVLETVIEYVPTTVAVQQSPVVSTVTETATTSCDYSCPTQYFETSVPTSSLSPSQTSLYPSDTSQGSLPPNVERGEDGVLRMSVCRDIIFVTPNPSQTEAAVASIVNELSVDTSNISAVVNAKVSAPDERTSSQTIGTVGIIFFIIPFLLLIAADVMTLLGFATTQS